MQKIVNSLILGIVLSLIGFASTAQEQTYLSVETTSTTMQTGQYYDVTIRIDSVTELWLADMQIRYDPSRIYVVGTVAGSPIQQGTLFSQNSSAIIRNQVDADLILYTISMLAPAEPITGGGIVGTFRIYPLASGTSQIFFSQATMVKSIFETRDGQRVGVGSETIAFTPVLLELTITGETVEVPSEATATPLPTETPLPLATEFVLTAVPTLVNVTAAPRTAEAIATGELPINPEMSASTSNLLLMLGIAVTVMMVIGFFVLFLALRRRK